MDLLSIWRRQLSPLPTCEGCDGDLPVVASDLCDPEVLQSEIRRIFVSKRTSSPFANWQNPGEWEARLNDTTTTDDDAIRTLWVTGDKPAPAQTVKEISNRRKKVVTKSHVVNWTIDDVQAEIHDFIRSLECGGYYRVWYETHGGLLFGGNTGIIVFLKGDMVLGRAKDDIMVYNGTMEWEAKFTEERATSPIFNYGTAATALYDTVVTFATSATPVAANGITGVAPATNATQKLEYIALSPTVGSNMTMTLKLGASTDLTVTFKSDYLGTSFKYIDTTGDVHYGNFTNGTITY